MSENLIQAVGIVAAICTTISFVPLMYLITVIGVSLWLIYGVLIHDKPLILANTVTVLLSGSILVMKIRYG